MIFANYNNFGLLRIRTIAAVLVAFFLFSGLAFADTHSTVIEGESQRLGWKITEGSKSEVSPSLVSQFNRATNLSRENKNEEAISLWDKMLSPSQAKVKATCTIDFLGTCYMRKAWCFMDLKRYAEAKRVFETPVLSACVPELSPKIRSEFNFSLANTLGELKDQPGMDRCFRAAFAENSSKTVDCYVAMIQFARRNGWTAYERKLMAEVDSKK